MAFIRRKKVHQYQYYQVVRNYRDKDGKSRQEMLCHLGVNSSVESAIAAERNKVNKLRERASGHRKHAQALRATHQKHFGWESDEGEFPLEGECERKLDYWEEQWEAYLHSDHVYSGTEFMDIEEIDAQIQKYMRCLTFYGAMRLARKADARADRHQKKLDKLLQVKREWF